MRLLKSNKIKVGIMACMLLSLSSCYLSKVLWYNFADIKDYKKFPSGPVNNTLEESEQFHFAKLDSAKNFDAIFNQKVKIKGKKSSLENALPKTGTMAFLIIRNDTILFEKYYKRADEASIFPSFSMAKSFVATLIGIAIKEKKIKSAQDHVAKYIKDIKISKKDSANWAVLSIENLLNMASGLEFSEKYNNPFSDVSHYYYGTDLRKRIRNLHFKCKPGTKYEYLSLNTQLLAWVLETATEKPIYEYLEEKLWKPLGMEYPATWSLDKPLAFEDSTSVEEKAEEAPLFTDVVEDPIEADSSSKEFKKWAKQQAKNKKNAAKQIQKEQEVRNEFMDAHSPQQLPMTKAFCCLNARARDYAKYGRLFLKKGKWNRVQIVSPEWVDKTYNCKDNLSSLTYSYHWWHTTEVEELGDTTYIPYVHKLYVQSNKKTKYTTFFATKQNPDLYADGYLGQYIYIDPAKNLIFVRLGKSTGDLNWPYVFKEIAKKL